MQINVNAPELLDALTLLKTSVDTLMSVVSGNRTLVQDVPQGPAQESGETAKANAPLTEDEIVDLRKKTKAFFAQNPDNRTIVKSWLDSHGYARVTAIERPHLAEFLQMVEGA